MKKLLLLFCWIPLFAWSQDSIQVNLKNPNAAIYNHIFFLQKDSYAPEKAAKSIYGLSKKEALDAAIKIKRVLDGKGLQIDFNKIPTNPKFKDSIGYNIMSKYVLFPDRMPQVSVEKKGDNWYYSEETLNSLDDLYSEVYPWYIEQIQDIVPGAGHKRVFGIEIWQYIAIILLVIASWILFAIAKRVAFTILKRVLFRFINSDNDEVVSALKKLAHPISLLVSLALIDKVFPSLQFGIDINKWVFLGINIAATVFWIYVFLKLAQVVVNIYQNYTAKTERKLDDQLVPILRNFLRGIIIIFGIFKMLTLIGVNPTAIIAGASIGGLAVAFASQDTVKNLIGTVMIFVDKPFHIGDWIQAGEVMGSVEEVGFRSTRVRAADTTVYQIPNSKLSEMIINNSGVRLYRRYNTQLGIRYDTPPELIEAFVHGIRELIDAHPETRSEAFNVEFVGFGDSALLIMMNMFLLDLNWGKEQSTKHEIHIAIVKLAKELGVDFAFPSTTLMIEQFPEKKGLDMDYNIDPKRLEAIVKKAANDFRKSQS